MSIISAFVLFQIIWWVVLFTILPIGVSIDENPQPGFATGTPIKTNLKWKLKVTTAIASVVWIIVVLIITSGLISLGE